VVIRNNLEKDVEELITTAGVPYFITSMSKGFTEHLPEFGGVYAGLGSAGKIQEMVEASDCVLWIGSYSVR